MMPDSTWFNITMENARLKRTRNMDRVVFFAAGIATFMLGYFVVGLVA